jgi:hypothetical protein
LQNSMLLKTSGELAADCTFAMKPAGIIRAADVAEKRHCSDRLDANQRSPRRSTQTASCVPNG